MHPQAPNTQTFLPACLLPTACDYNGLDCFDPLATISDIGWIFSEISFFSENGVKTLRRLCSSAHPG
jgi:hypothetical protein